MSELAALNFTAFDVETANEQRNSLCSIGIVKIRNGKIERQISYHVRPLELRLTDINQQIHKLSKEDLMNERELNSIWNELAPFFENEILVAHNAEFDIDVLQQSLGSYNLKLPRAKYLCSVKLAQEAFGDLGNYSLKDVAEYFGIELDHHNAVSDAKACAHIALRALPKINATIFNWNSDELTCDIQKIVSDEKRDVWEDLFGEKKIDSALLKPNLNIENKDNVFYNRKVVFTGDLENVQRTAAAKKIQAMGADINTSISKRTNIVIIGKGAGPSKMKKINELMANGCPIRLIYEEEFISLITSKIHDKEEG